MTALDHVLDRLKNVQQEGDGYKASCPVPTHGRGRGDRYPSLSICTDTEGNVLLRCFANCVSEAVVDALGLSIADLFERRNGHRTGVGGGGYNPPELRSTHQPATLENYAAYVGLPVGYLKVLGLGEISYDGESALRTPYLDESGEEVLLTRFRVSLTGKHFEIPEPVRMATEDFKNTNDVPAAFIADVCITGDAAKLEEQAQELYIAYRHWCRENGHKPVSATKVAREWERLGFEKKTRGGRTFYRGLKVDEGWIESQDNYLRI
jgi:hypothetical protein